MNPECPSCGNKSEFLLRARDNRKLSDANFSYYRCGNCGLVFLNPIPADLRSYYEGGYQSIPADIAELRALSSKEKFRLDSLLPYKSSGRLLEIGAWIGLFSINAKDAGFVVDAIDIDPQAVEFLNSVGINARQSSNPAVALEELESYDAIVLWHSLEHLPTPWKVIENAAKRLNQNGVLLIAIPNIASDDAKRQKSRWIHLDAPRHLYFYSPEALSALAAKSELTPLLLTTNDPLSNELSFWSWRRFFYDLVPIRYVRGLISLVCGTLTYKLSNPAEGKGAGITAIFARHERSGS